MRDSRFIVFSIVIIIVILFIIILTKKSASKKPQSLHEIFSYQDMEEAEDAVDSLCNTLNIKRHSDLEQDD